MPPLDSHSTVVVVIGALFLLVLVASGFALGSGVTTKRFRGRQLEFEKFIQDLQKQGEKLSRKLGRGCFGYRAMSACLAAIEVFGGAYFAITGSSPTTNQIVGNHITVATVIGFAILVTSAIQNRVHPYTKAVELRFRKWNLDSVLDLAEQAKKDRVPDKTISHGLIRAIREATRPFSDRPERNVPDEGNPFQIQPSQSAPPATPADAPVRQVAGIQGTVQTAPDGNEAADDLSHRKDGESKAAGSGSI